MTHAQASFRAVDLITQMSLIERRAAGPAWDVADRIAAS